MKALQYTRIGSHPEVVEIDRPVPGPGQVLLRVTAAGVCHSDEYVMGLSEEEYRSAGYPLPLTLGHEGAGVVEELGAGVEHLAVATPSRSTAPGAAAAATRAPRAARTTARTPRPRGSSLPGSARPAPWPST